MTIEFWDVRGYHQTAKKIIGAEYEAVNRHFATNYDRDLELYFGITSDVLSQMGKKRKRKLYYMLTNKIEHCHYCHKRIGVEEATWDHVISRGKGGLNHQSNMVIACEPCNHEKGSKSAASFVQSNYLLNRKFLWSMIED